LKFEECQALDHIIGSNYAKYQSSTLYKELGNLLPLCREIAGARDILQKFENLKKQDE
jgi:hypothetical protein